MKFFKEIIRYLGDKYLPVQNTPTVNEWRERFEQMPRIVSSGGIMTLDIAYQDTDIAYQDTGGSRKTPGKLIFNVDTRDLTIAIESARTSLKDVKPRLVQKWDLPRVFFPDDNNR